jgi:hypothetical protein
VLIGIGVAAIDENQKQCETLLNPNYLGQFVDLDEKPTSRGGRQSLLLPDRKGEIRITMEEGRLPFFTIRQPTPLEMEMMKPIWLVPLEETTHGARKVLANRRNRKLVQPPPAPWTERLGNCPSAILDKTLESTTQLCTDGIEMDHREIPRVQRQQRAHPIHGRRLKGRTDTDTFFASLKSIRGYRCCQLFVHILSQFVFVTLLRKESQNLRAYEDFVTEVGTPNLLLSDNAQSQTGRAWTTFSRKNHTKTATSAPHKQNQNQAERKIGDVKRRVCHTLFCSGAPLVFWCYCVQFVVACLNVTARRRLDWRTPTEALEGFTPDISRHQFHFWEPVWYYEPTVRFPDSPWKAGWFIGFADRCGDSFTYKVWTCLDPTNADYTTGRELTRDIVIRRKRDSPAPPALHTFPPGSHLDFESSRQRQHRKSRQNTRSKLVRHQKATMAQSGPNKSRKRKRNDPATTPWQATVSNDITLTSADFLDDEESIGNDTDLGTVTDPFHRNVPSATTDTHTSEEDANSRGEMTTDRGDYVAPFNDYEEITMMDDVENELSGNNLHQRDRPGPQLCAISSHKWCNGQLFLKSIWDTEEETWYPYSTLREDHPRLVAQYIIDHPVTNRARDPKMAWAKKVLRDLDRTTRRLQRLYTFHLDEKDRIYKSRRRVRGSKKKKRVDFWTPVYKYGIEVPKNTKHALELDEKSGNNLWAEAIDKEVNSLIDMSVFEFHPSDYRPTNDYQKTTLHCIYDVKHDLRRKARMVAGGHLIDVPSDVQIYASQVKPISVKLISVIAHAQGLEEVCGDIGNAYVNAYTSERVYAIAGKEFGDKEGQVVVIQKALYGLAASGADWYRHFSNSLRSYGFQPTRYDRDVWYRKSEDGPHYEYVCTHVDDFKVAAKAEGLKSIMEKIKAEYSVRGDGPLEYYLGNDYKMYNGMYAVGCKKYIKESLRRVAADFGMPPKQSTPLPQDDHPELDTSPLLNDIQHKKYQMLIGMLNWIVGIGRFDIAHATAQLARFSSCPREGHLKRALRVFGYLRKRKNRRILIDSREPVITGVELADGDKLARDMAKEYPGATEMLDSSSPTPLVNELAITCFVDADHGFDKVTRRSVTGIVILVGRTPVYYFSKRQGSVETSTYSAEFLAMKTAIDEIIAIRYMLRCLGVRVETASYLFCDNLGVVQNATIKDSLLKKKHVALSYHRVREAVAASIVIPIKVHTSNNYADALTKSLGIKDFERLVSGLLYF